MHITLLFVIVAVGALAFIGRIPSKPATWTVVVLAVYGIFTSPDVATRLTVVGATIAGPLVPYTLRIVAGLTIHPLLHYFRYTSDAHRALFSVVPTDPLFGAAGEQVDKHAASLVSAGFVSRGRIGLRVGKNTVVNELLDRGDGSEWAVLTATIPAGVQPVILHCTCEFAGGETLVVNNYPWVDPNPPTPGNENVRLPSLGDVDDIVRACLTLATKSTHGPVVRTPLDTDLATRAKDRTKLRYDAELRAGYLRYDVTGDVYRPTLRNAYWMFWRSLPPLNAIVERRDRERERKLLEEMKLTPAVRTDAAPGGAESAPSSSTGSQKPLSFAAAAALIAVIVLMPDLPDLLFGRPADIVRPTITVPAALSVPDSFPLAVQALEGLVGQPTHRLMGTRDDEPAPTPGVAISMHRDSADAYVTSTQDAFLARGFYLFRTGERATSGLETEALALYPTRDPYEVMRAMETNGWNHGMSTEEVIAWFRREEAKYPIRFGAIAFDYVGGRLLGDVPDETGFGRRLLKFCPDIQARGPVSARSLGRDFKRTREIFCWWD